MAALYEERPYPPVGYLSLLFQRIRWEERPTLNYRAAYAAAFGSLSGAAARPRILVAGSGTFEPLVVALANPGAELLAVDLSERSLRRLERLAWLRGLSGRIRCWQGAIEELPAAFGSFDLVVATGVVHHLADPARGLALLKERTGERGVLRLMIYSRLGRELLYRAKELAGTLGLDTPAKVRRMMASLPADHPYRIYFHLYTDARTDSGLADGYLHPCDSPCTAFELRELLLGAGLRVARFLHSPEGQPGAADALAALPPSAGDWERLQLLEAFGELQENFRFLACREDAAPLPPGSDLVWNEALPRKGELHSRLLGRALRFDRARAPGEYSEAERADLLRALYLLPGEGA